MKNRKNSRIFERKKSSKKGQKQPIFMHIVHYTHARSPKVLLFFQKIVKNFPQILPCSLREISDILNTAAENTAKSAVILTLIQIKAGCIRQIMTYELRYSYTCTPYAIALSMCPAIFIFKPKAFDLNIKQLF